MYSLWKRAASWTSLFFALLVFLLNLRVNLIWDAFLRSLLTWLLFWLTLRRLLPHLTGWLVRQTLADEEEVRGQVIDVRLSDEGAVGRVGVEEARSERSGEGEEEGEMERFEPWDLDNFKLPK